jgi:hypothetical protein
MYLMVLRWRGVLEVFGEKLKELPSDSQVK